MTLAPGGNEDYKEDIYSFAFIYSMGNHGFSDYHKAVESRSAKSLESHLYDYELPYLFVDFSKHHPLAKDGKKFLMYPTDLLVKRADWTQVYDAAFYIRKMETADRILLEWEYLDNPERFQCDFTESEFWYKPLNGN